MEEGWKSSVMVYTDWKSVVDRLTDEELAKLMRHFFRYINGAREEAPDRLTSLIFEPWRQTLDRDAAKWEAKCQKNRESGQRGGERKAMNKQTLANASECNQTLANASECNQTPANLADRDNDRDNDNDNDSDNDRVTENNTPTPPTGGACTVSSCSESSEFYPFDEFWSDYDKKVGDKEKLRRKWNKLSLADRRLIKAFIPLYKRSEPNKKYRKNPETFLNNKSWNDELIDNNKPKQSGSDYQQRRESVANLKNLCVAILTGDSVPERP